MHPVNHNERTIRRTLAKLACRLVGDRFGRTIQKNCRAMTHFDEFNSEAMIAARRVVCQPAGSGFTSLAFLSSPSDRVFGNSRQRNFAGTPDEYPGSGVLVSSPSSFHLRTHGFLGVDVLFRIRRDQYTTE